MKYIGKPYYLRDNSYVTCLSDPYRRLSEDSLLLAPCVSNQFNGTELWVFSNPFDLQHLHTSRKSTTQMILVKDNNDYIYCVLFDKKCMESPDLDMFDKPEQYYEHL